MNFDLNVTELLGLTISSIDKRELIRTYMSFKKIILKTSALQFNLTSLANLAFSSSLYYV